MTRESYVMVIITTSNQEEAEKIGKTLVEEKLAACAKIIPSIKSLFFWKGEFNNISESIIFLNTRGDLFEKLKERVHELHSYEVPEVIALPILAGSSEFLVWIKENTTQ
jgi:periplasmic divalent cation tolerance protein